MSEPHWVSQELALALHAASLERFGGSDGLRDVNLLESSLSRPLQLFFYENASLFQLAAAYTHGLIKNHPFVDGNKRTAFLAGAIFLEKNGLRLEASEADAYTYTYGLAASTISQENYALWLEESCRQS